MLFAPRKIIEGRFSGHYQTRQRGQSVEFRDYREYIPGDAISAIDWNVYGRTDKLVVKLFEHQSELTLQLLIDASASMAYSGLKRESRRSDSKFDYACRLAASIAFLVMRQHDRFAFGLARDGLTKYQGPDRRMQHLAGMLSTLEKTSPRGSAGLADAIDDLARAGGRRSLLVLFSDLIDDAGEVARAIASRVHSGGETVVFQILHPHEIRLPNVEHGLFIDSESGARLRVHVDDVRADYEQRMKRLLHGWTARFRSLGVDYTRAETSTPYYRLLERYLAGRLSTLR